MIDRYDSASYAAGIGARPAQGLTSRVAHAAAIEVAAWSRPAGKVGQVGCDRIAPFRYWSRIPRRFHTVSLLGKRLGRYWDDRPAHGGSRHGYWTIFSGSWCAAGILLPFTHRALRSLISRYQHVLEKKVSPARPYERKINDRIITITNIWKLEFYDFKELTKNLLTSQESSLLSVAGCILKQSHHFDLIEPDAIAQFPDHYEATVGDVDFDIPG
jgi:hypothetical protein